MANDDINDINDINDIDYNNYNNVPWVLINSYFKNQHLKQLVKHQIESYNQFINRELVNTINMFNPLTILSDQYYDKDLKTHTLEVHIKFTNFNIHRPQLHENNGATKIMFPQDARLRNFTYASNMLIDLNIEYVVKSGEKLTNIRKINKIIPNIHIGKIPVMLKSNICILDQYNHLNCDVTGECKMDPGGYFIINGSEKTCIGQERAAENQIYCFNTIKSNKWNWVAEYKAVPDWKYISPKQLNIMISVKNNGFGNGMYLEIPRLKHPIPLFIIFRAFGVLTDKEICEKIVLDINNKNNKKLLFSLQASIVDANNYLTYDSAIKYITNNVVYTPLNLDKENGYKKKYDFAIDVLNNDIFPNVHNNTQKVYLLGYMTNILLKTSFGWLKCSDRDSYINKRIDLTGTLINNLFRNYFNKLVKDMNKQIVKELNTGSWKSTEDYDNIINLTNIYKIVKSTTIENGLKRALSTGDFGIKHINNNKVGVAQVLNRLTYIASLSHLRRINTPIDKSGKLIPPRRLHNSSWGFLCPAECFDPDTPIIMWNGKVERAGNIKVGDILIDDNGYPTKVRSTCFGQKNMYDVIPDKSNFIKHRVTDNHILTLKIRQHKSIVLNNRKDRPKRFIVKFFDRMVLQIKEKSFETLEKSVAFVNEFNDDDTLDITIEDYLKLNSNTRKHLVLFKTNEINWEKKEITMDPYLLGMWLGDGLSNGTGFALNYKTDFETLDYWQNWADNNGALITKDKRYKYSIVSLRNKLAGEMGLCNRVEKAPLKKYLQVYNLINNKHIPNNYLINDRETRLKVLAGLVDTDGSVRAKGKEIRICQGPNNYRIIEDAYTLAMSLGFSCGIKEGQSQWTDKKSGDKKFSSYKELMITGSKIYEIPTLLPRKKLNKITDARQIQRAKSFKGSHFNLVESGIGNFVGWQLEDKRGRFLLSDGVVVHNTPEGGSVGVVKNLSYLCHITIPSCNKPLYEYVDPMIKILDKCTNDELSNNVKVFISGIWVGVTDNAKELYENLKSKKHNGIINVYTSVVFDYNLQEIRICNDAGRLCRPLLIVKNNKLLLNSNIIKKLENKELEWDDLLIATKIDKSVLEYVDSYEQNSSLIAMKPNQLIKNDNNYIYNYTHCEIHPSTIFGILASCIPFPDHNQSPRNTYQAAMGKQAMGVYVTNYNNRMDKTAYVLSYPMRPLVETRFMNIIQLNEIPSGEMVVVAIMSHTGYNQEDSLLFNRGAIDRGLFQAVIYHTEKDEDKKLYGDEEIRCKPDKTITKCIKFANYEKINGNGIVDKDTIIKDRDVIIAKILPIKENRNDYTKVIKFEDDSRIYRTNEETFIDQNLIDKNGDGYNFCKVKLRTVRKPVIGDKFSSRHGQKGTIGNVIPEQDMPFTANGIRPDIIINPHAIPSRMTIAQLKETLLGKVLLDLGLFGDGTSFGDFEIKDICKKLQDIGYESNGNEVMYNGMTGEQLNCNIFIGPAFYQRLKHMVNDKQHSRSIGPMVNLTRQPAEGRSKDGGLRFGEMERDCMVSHGASRFTKGRIYDASDSFSAYVCNKCGLIAKYNDKQHIHICNTCNNRTDFKYVEIPYSCKLLFQELISMNIAPRIVAE